MKKVFVFFLVIVILAYGVMTAFAEEGSLQIEEDFLNNADVTMEQGVLVLSNTTQVNTGVKVASGSDSDSFVKEVIYLLPSDDTDVESLYEELVASSGSGDKTETLRDSSISVEGYVTIYYDRQSIEDGEYVRITQAEGGYRIMDHQVKVTSQLVNVGCSGWNLGEGWVDQNDAFNVSSTSWSYATPSDWLYVCTNNGPSLFAGANCEYILQRVGSSYTWELYIENNL